MRSSTSSREAGLSPSRNIQAGVRSSLAQIKRVADDL